MSTAYYIDQLRERLAAGISRHAILLSARRHRQPDSELRRSRADRYSAHRQRTCRPTIGWRRRSPTASSRFPAPSMFTSSSCSPPDAVPERRPHARAIRRTERAGRGQQPAAHAELELPDQSFVLGESGQRHRIQRGRAGAAVQDRFHAVARQYSRFRRPLPASRKSAEQPRAGESERAAGADLPLQQPAHDRHLRLGGRARSGRRGQRHPEGSERISEASSRAARRSSCAARSPP